MRSVHSTEATIVVAEMDRNGRLTGAAAEAFASEESGIYTNWATFGTWEAFQQQLSAEARIDEEPPEAFSDKENDGFTTCPGCLSTYWSEDGHPTGTLCPFFGNT